MSRFGFDNEKSRQVVVLIVGSVFWCLDLGLTMRRAGLLLWLIGRYLSEEKGAGQWLVAKSRCCLVRPCVCRYRCKGWIRSRSVVVFLLLYLCVVMCRYRCKGWIRSRSVVVLLYLCDVVLLYLCVDVVLLYLCVDVCVGTDAKVGSGEGPWLCSCCCTLLLRCVGITGLLVNQEKVRGCVLVVVLVCCDVSVQMQRLDQEQVSGCVVVLV